jgi:kinetochore protein Nuf2
MREVKKELQKQLEASKEEAELRKAQIVSSPARLKSEIVSLEGLVAQEQRAVDELDEQKRILSRQLEVVAKAEKDINKAMLLMGEAEAEAKKLKAVLKDEKQRKGEAEAIAADTDAQQAQLDHALAQKRRAEEKLRDVKEALGQRLSAQIRAIEVTRREASEYAEELKAAVDSRRAAEAEKMKLERHQASLMAKHSQEVAEMISTMRHFSVTVSQYDSGLISALSGIDAIEVSPVRS